MAYTRDQDLSDDPRLRGRPQPPAGFTFDPTTQEWFGPDGSFWDPRTGEITPPRTGPPTADTGMLDRRIETPPPPSPPPPTTPPPPSTPPPPPSGRGIAPGPLGSTGLTVGSLIAPFTEQFTAPPAPSPFSYPAFTAPTGVTEQNDPGYRFRLSEGERALEQSASARGVLNTGGTLKDVLDYGQNYASGEFKNVYDRGVNNYLTNYGVARDVFDRNFNVNQEDYNRAWSRYMKDFDIYTHNQDSAFNKLYLEQQLGVNATQ